MKTKILLLIAVVAILATPARSATAVMFPIQAMFGGGNYTRTFRADSTSPLITDNTSVYVGSYYLITPTGGTNPIVWMTPNNYVVTFPDARTPWRISVPNTNTVQNALALTSTNAMLATYVYVPWPTNYVNVTNAVTVNQTNNLTVTNVVTVYQTNSLVPALLASGSILANWPVVDSTSTNQYGMTNHSLSLNAGFVASVTNAPTNFISGFTGSVTNFASMTLLTNYSCTITGTNGTFTFGVGPTITVRSNYLVTGSGIADGNYAYTGSYWIIAGSPYNPTLTQVGGYWKITGNFGSPICTSSIGAFSAPPETPQVWTGSGWTGGGGVLPWTISSINVGTNQTIHYNILTFTNGVCTTNLFQ